MREITIAISRSIACHLERQSRSIISTNWSKLPQYDIYITTEESIRKTNSQYDVELTGGVVILRNPSGTRQRCWSR